MSLIKRYIYVIVWVGGSSLWERMEMARDLKEAIERIEEIAPDALVKELEIRYRFWPADYQWDFLRYHIEEHIAKDSSDPVSVGIYAILYDCDEEETKRRLKEGKC